MARQANDTGVAGEDCTLREYASKTAELRAFAGSEASRPTTSSRVRYGFRLRRRLRAAHIAARRQGIDMQRAVEAPHTPYDDEVVVARSRRARRPRSLRSTRPSSAAAARRAARSIASSSTGAATADSWPISRRMVTSVLEAINGSATPSIQTRVRRPSPRSSPGFAQGRRCGRRARTYRIPRPPSGCPMPHSHPAIRHRPLSWRASPLSGHPASNRLPSVVNRSGARGLVMEGVLLTRQHDAECLSARQGPC